jgi:hypothetical protein
MPALRHRGYRGLRSEAFFFLATGQQIEIGKCRGAAPRLRYLSSWTGGNQA